MQVGVFDHVDKSDLPVTRYYEERLQIIEAFEKAGFISYHCAEHHLSPIGMAPSPSVFLSAVAQRTRKLRFGPMIFISPLYDPLRLLQEICMLDQMSGGRFEMGFGRGAAAAELRYFHRDPKNAPQEHEAAVKFVLDALRDGSVDVPSASGTRRMPLTIGAVQTPHPPIWYGVHSVESAERAARRGYHLVSLDKVDETRAYFDRYREVRNETSAENGNGTGIPKLGFSNFIVVGRDGAKAREVARRAYSRWHQNFYYTSRTHGYEITLGRPAEFDEMCAQGKAVAGTPFEVAESLKGKLEGSGANYLVGQFAFGDLSLTETLESVRLFSTEVMPAISAIQA